MVHEIQHGVGQAEQGRVGRAVEHLARGEERRAVATNEEVELGVELVALLAEEPGQCGVFDLFDGQPVQPPLHQVRVQGEGPVVEVGDLLEAIGSKPLPGRVGVDGGQGEEGVGQRRQLG